MANGGRIDYTVGFKVDQSGLNQIKANLTSIQQGSTKDFVGLKGLQDADKKLIEIKKTASDVEAALNRSFNSNLGTLNISKFNQELKKLDIKKVYTDFSQLGPVGQNAFRNITSQILTTNLQLKQTNKWLDEMAITMANSVKWGVTSSIWNNMTGAVEKAWNFAKKLDTSLNDIRIVTQKSADDMERYAIAANKAAKNLGQTTTQYTNASLIYYQQGLSDAEVQARTETTLKAANVTGQSAAEVSEQLTAVWNGYKVSTQEAELYVDKLSAVAATTAADLEELSTGMSKVASAANIMGVDIDQLNAQLATVVSVTRQAPESVGTAFKTIYARMGDIEAGLDTETTLGEYTEKMSEMGFNVLDTNGKLKDMGSVIDEIGNKWTNLSREQQVALSQIMAGTRQYNNLLALFDNWDMYSKAIETSKNATGALQRQQDIYMESMEAHLQQLQTAGEGVYNALFNAEDFNPIIDALTGVVSLFKNFVDAAGGAQGLLLLLGNTAVSVFNKQIASGLATTIANFKTAKENANQLKAEMEILSKYENANINDSRTQNLINMKRQILDYDKIITEEERNQANEIIRQTNELYKQQDLLEKKKAQVQEVAFRYTGSEIDLSDQNARETLIKDLEEDVLTFSNHLKTSLSGSQDNPSTLSASIAELQRLKKALDGTRESQQAYSEAIQKVANQVRFQKTGINNLIDTYKLSSEQQEKLTNAVQKYDTAIQQSGRAGLKNAQAVASAKEMHEAYIQVLRELIKDGKMSIDVLQGLQKNQDNLNNSLTAGQQAWRQYLSQIDLKAKVQQVINFANGLGRVSMTLSSLGRIDDIFKDVNLSAGEKLLQIMSAISISIPGIISLGSAIGKITGLTELWNVQLALSAARKQHNLALDIASNAAETRDQILKKKSIRNKKVINEILKEKNWLTTQEIASMSWENIQESIDNKLTEKGIKLNSVAANLLREEIKLRYLNATATAVENGEQAKQNLLSKEQITLKLKEFQGKVKEIWDGFNGLTGGAKIFAGALGAIAVTAAITAGTLAFVNRDINQLTEEAKKASESLNTLTETYDAAKSAFESFQSEISDYKKAKTALDDMVTGTEEWKNAVEDVNKQVIDLISNYKELAPYVQKSESGELSISEKGMRVVEQLERDKLNNQYQQLNAARINNSKAQSELSIGQTKEGMEVFGDFAAGGITATSGLVGAIVGGLTGFIAGPLGIIVGAAIGAAAGGVASAITEEIANVQEKDIKAVTEAYSIYGEELFKEENFSKIMSKASGVTENEIKALWANREKLIELSRSVDANTQAQQAYMQQYVQSALEGNEIYETSKNKQDLEKMVAAATNKNLDTFVDKWADKLGGKTDKEIQKAYAKLMKWETTSIDNQTGNKATYYFNDGTSKTIDDATARYALAMAEASENATESLREFQLAIDSTNQKLNASGLENEMLSTFFEGKVGDLSNYTGAEVERLSEIEFTDEEAIARGYENAQDLEAKIDQAREDFNRWFNETTDKTKDFIDQSRYEAFETVIDFEKLSLTANKNLSKAVIDAFKYGGDEGLNALLEMIQNVPEDKMEDFLALVGNIDLTNANTFDTLKDSLEELGLNLSNFDGFDIWGQIIENAINKNQSFEATIDRMISKLQTATDILNDLSVGDIIDKEKYDDLISFNPNLATFFQELPGGEKYRNIGFDLGGWQEVEGSYNALNLANDYLKESEQQRRLNQTQESLINTVGENFKISSRSNMDNFISRLEKDLDSLVIPTENLDEVESRFSEYMSYPTSEKGEDLEKFLADSSIKIKQKTKQSTTPPTLGSLILPLSAPLSIPSPSMPDYIYTDWTAPELKGVQADQNNLIEIINSILDIDKKELSIATGASLDFINKTLEELQQYANNPQQGDFSTIYEKTKGIIDQINSFLERDTSFKNIAKENEILTQTTSLEQLNAVFTSGIGTVGEYVKQYQYLSREMAIAAGVEEEQIQLYKDKIDAIDGMTNHMAEATAAQILLTQVGLKDLVDNWDDQLNKISNLDKFAPDYADAVDQVAESLSQVFNVEKDFFTDDFIKFHREDITKMVNGDEEAFAHLKDIITDKVQASLKRDLINSGKGDLVPQFNNLIDQLQTHLDKLSFGDKIDLTFAEQMASILRNAGKTSAQIMAIFSSMGIAINEDWLKSLEIKALFDQEGYEDIIAAYGNDEQKESMAIAKHYGGSQLSPTYFKQTAQNILNSYFTEGADAEAIFTGIEDMFDSILNPEEKETEAEVDRYQRVNTELADIANNLNKIKNAQEHLIGKNLISNLEKQLKLLEQQEAVQKRKIEIAKQEASEIGGQLKAQFGIQFDENNLISNYLDIAKNLNSNALSELNELVQKYDGVINDTIPNLIEEIQQAAYEKISLQVEAFDVTINTKLDTSEAERNWEEMRNKLFSDWNLGEDAAAKEIWDSISTYGDHFQSYIDFSDLANSETEVRIEKLNRLMSERNKIEKDSVRYNQAKANGTLGSFETTSMYTTIDDRGNFFFDETAYQENLKEAINDVYAVVEDIQQLGESLNQAWIDTFSNAASAFDNQLSMYENMEDLFQRSIRLAELTQKSGDFTNITEAYSGRIDNYKEQLTSLAQYINYFADAYKTAMDNGNEEAAAEAYNQYITYLGKYEDAAEKTITTISEKAKAEFNKAFGQKFSLKFDPSSMAEWGESLIAGSEVFFDPVESSYEIDKLGRKIKKTIDESMNLTAQKKLNEFREKEMKLLREKDKLSADDIKRAELKFELLQKQIALEEAQKNKNTMRLRKDAMGNYTFEFVADEEQTEEAQQELSDARYNLWEHNMEGIQDSTQEYYSKLGKFREEINSILMNANITDKDAEIETATAKFAPQLEQTLNEGYSAIRSQIEDVLGSEGGLDAIAGSFGLEGQEFLNRFFGGLSEENLAAGEYSNEQLQNFMTQLLNIPTEAQEYFSYVAEGNTNINTMMREMANEAKRLAEEAQTETNSQMDNVNTILVTTAEKVTGLSTTFETAAGTLGGIATSIGEMVTPAIELTTRYGELLDKVAAATSAYESTYADFLAKNKHFFEETMPKTESIYSTFEDFAEEVRSLADSNIVAGIGNLTYAIEELANTLRGGIIDSSQFGAITSGVWTTKKTEKTKQGLSSSGSYKKGALEEVDSWTNSMQVEYVLLAEKDSGQKVGWIERAKWEQFDTGGYTGEWGAEGKAAILHEKELVLNKNDTENILEAVNIIRNIGDIAENINQALFNGLQKIVNKFIPSSVSIGNVGIDNQEQRLDQNVHITAEFPNVTDAKEVENALNNLVNVATQYAFDKKK